MNKKTAAFGIATALTFLPVTAMAADSHPTAAPQQEDTTTDDDDSDKTGLWGLLGLLGLAGLAGLKRRDRHDDTTTRSGGSSAVNR